MALKFVSESMRRGMSRSIGKRFSNGSSLSETPPAISSRIGCVTVASCPLRDETDSDSMMQAEAIREKRARIIKAEAELEASVKLSAAAAQMMANPAALELRRMQMISEVGAESTCSGATQTPPLPSREKALAGARHPISCVSPMVGSDSGLLPLGIEPV